MKMKIFLVAIALLASAARAAQPDDQLWQQLIGTKEAQCSQAVIDAAREINKLRAQVEELQKQLKSKEGGK